ncbi:MAG: DUF86 domain-containing protein [Candidatus Aenigmarchaeota archaeon]|nr:DUF86 domain-containing protein [Candidatus Aenigmarchaeota archaeon]
MKKDPLVFIKHIRDSIKEIENYTKNVSKESFINNKEKQSAVIRQIEVIGEATKNLPKEFIKKYPSEPWEDIAGMRDKLIHHYFDVDLDLTFDVVKNHLPKLKKTIEKILEENE